MHTLIAHLGNRNLTVDGQFVADYIKLANKALPPQDKFTFLTFTRKLWNDYNANPAQTLPRLALNILTAPDVLALQATHVILTCTDQKPTPHEKDTKYEAALVKAKLSAELGTACPPIDVWRLHSNPTDPRALEDEMRPLLLALAAQHTAHDIHFLNAGGTPQQKNALYTLLEYYTPPKHFKPLAKTEGSHEVLPYDHGVERRYTLMGIAAQYVQDWEFRNAAAILKQLKAGGLLYRPEETTALAICHVTACRLRYDEPSQAANEASQILKGSPAQLPHSLAQFLQGQPPKAFLENASLPPTARFTLAESLHIARHHLLNSPHYAVGVLAIFNVVEQLGHALAAAKELETKNETERKEAAKKLWASIGVQGKDLWNQSLFISLAAAHPDAQLSALGTGLKAYNSQTNGSFGKRGLDLLRNRCYLAHNTGRVGPGELGQHAPGFLANLPNLLAEVGLGPCPYAEARAHALALLKGQPVP